MGTVVDAIKSRLPRFLRVIAEFGQRFGVNITPNHFYSGIPDFRHLRRTSYWRRPFSMHSINGAEVDPQLEFARACCTPYMDRVARNDIRRRAVQANGELGFGPTEADFLYCYIRSQKPPRIVQVGCGVSTAVILMAADEEPGYKARITCIDPYPTNYLKRIDAEGRISLLPQMAQTVPLERFTELGEGGLLFIDSSHSVRPGSEVIQLIAESLPRLAAGARVHFHDISFPYDYSPSMLDRDIFFGRERTLLYAFLLCNPRFRIEVSLSMLHYAHPSAMQKILPNYRPCKTQAGVLVEDGHFPSSIYLRVTG